MSFRRSRTILIFSLLIFSLIQVTAVKSLPGSTPDIQPQVQVETVKIMAYNILESGKHIEWKEVVKQANPDILIAVETGGWNGPTDPTLRTIKDEFNTYFSSEKPYEVWATNNNPSTTAGEAIFSRYPILNGTTIVDVTLDNGGIKKAHNPFMDAVVNISGIVTHVFGVHLKCCSSTSGLEQVNREQDTEGILNYMDNLGNVPIIYAGDLNSFSPVDVKLWHEDTGLGYGPMEMMLNSSSPYASKTHTFYDMYRELNPYDRGYTYVDKFYNSRIDYIVLNQYFKDMLVNSTVIDDALAQKGSDHFPLDGFLNLQPTLKDLRPPARIYNTTGVLGTNSFNLTWDPSPAVDFVGYRVYRNSTMIKTTTVAHFNDTGLPSNTLYVYQVSAYDNSSNEGLKSHSLYVNTSYGILTSPGAPLNVTITVGENQLKVRWNPPNSDGGTSVIKYNVYRTTNPSFKYILWASTSGFSYTDTRTISNFVYYYKVKAVNFVGEGNFSAGVSGRPLTPNSTAPSSTPTPTQTVGTSPIQFTVTFTSVFITIFVLKKQKKTRI